MAIEQAKCLLAPDFNYDCNNDGKADKEGASR